MDHPSPPSGSPAICRGRYWSKNMRAGPPALLLVTAAARYGTELIGPPMS
jgi:hypothetical protein